WQPRRLEPRAPVFGLPPRPPPGSADDLRHGGSSRGPTPATSFRGGHRGATDRRRLARPRGRTRPGRWRHLDRRNGDQDTEVPAFAAHQSTEAVPISSRVAPVDEEADRGATISAAEAGARSTAEASAAVAQGSTEPRPRSNTSSGAHVGAASRLDTAILRTQAKAALTGLGWKPAIACSAIAAALAATDGDAVTLEQLVFESLRRCPVPRA